LDVAAASAGTGLVAGAIAALESDQPHRLTRPPYGDAYRRTYALFLDRVASGETQAPTGVTQSDETEVATRAEEDLDEVEPDVIAVGGVPLPAVRVLAALSSAVAIGLVVWGLRQDLAPGPAAPGEVVVRVVLQRTTRLTVTVDGVVKEEREFAGREDVTWRGASSIDVAVRPLGAGVGAHPVKRQPGEPLLVQVPRRVHDDDPAR
jgi:hypothetical protein